MAPIALLEMTRVAAGAPFSAAEIVPDAAGFADETVFPDAAEEVEESVGSVRTSFATFLIVFCDSLRMFWYSCDEKVDAADATTAPMMVPAMPSFEESRKTVPAASAPARICTHEIPLKKRRKKFFTLSASDCGPLLHS